MKTRAAGLILVLSLVGAFAQPAGKPQYGAWGFDTEGADLKTKPGDDFFRYANGAWLDRVQIPADKPGYSLRLAMTDLTEQRLHDLMEESAKKTEPKPATIEGKVGAFYKSFMDEAAVEKAGASSLKDKLSEVRAAKTREALASMMGRQNADFHGGIFALGIDVDIKDPKHYTVYLGQAGLGLPDRDYYLKPDFAEKKQKYQAYAGQLLRLLAWPDAEKRATEIIDLESKIADASWTKTQQRDPIATYNAMSIAELEAFAPKFAWRKFLAEAGLPKVERVVVAEKSAFPKIAEIFDKTPVETLQAWQAFNIADHAAPYLSKAFVDALFEMRNKTLSGQAEQ
ncbi:MAG TPA: M13 family metallopeptidase N-terminal domain-containing protein, partial [Chthoniobacterales bacterium]|nr:M13 family metallopeptidase N-terminal domain-containing protein [Chthoniobacterales bacterium]